jgi:hypothetical protein
MQNRKGSDPGGVGTGRRLLRYDDCDLDDTGKFGATPTTAGTTRMDAPSTTESTTTTTEGRALSRRTVRPPDHVPTRREACAWAHLMPVPTPPVPLPRNRLHGSGRLVEPRRSPRELSPAEVQRPAVSGHLSERQGPGRVRRGLGRRRRRHRRRPGGLVHGTPRTDRHRTRTGDIGGLEELQLDISLDPSWDVTCPYSEGLPVVPFIIGNGISSLHHVTFPGFEERLYLLEWNGGNVAIEVGSEGQSLDEYLAEVQPIIESLHFGSRARGHCQPRRRRRFCVTAQLPPRAPSRSRSPMSLIPPHRHTRLSRQRRRAAQPTAARTRCP